MKIYCLKVIYEDFEYDEIDQVVVIAENEEQATAIARTQRAVNWEITGQINTIDAPPQLVSSYIHHG